MTAALRPEDARQLAAALLAAADRAEKVAAQRPISTLTGQPCTHPADHRCVDCVGEDEVTVPRPGWIKHEPIPGITLVEADPGDCTCDYGSTSPGVVEPPGHDPACPAHGCSCGSTYATYNGPEPDCPVHGAVRALNEAQAARDRWQRIAVQLARYNGAYNGLSTAERDELEQAREAADESAWATRHERTTDAADRGPE